MSRRHELAVGLQDQRERSRVGLKAGRDPPAPAEEGIEHAVAVVRHEHERPTRAPRHHEPPVGLGDDRERLVVRRDVGGDLPAPAEGEIEIARDGRTARRHRGT